MPATPLDSIGLTQVGGASIFAWEGGHEISNMFELIKGDTDRVMIALSETSGCDLNLDLTIQPKPGATANPLVVNSASGTLLAAVNTSGTLTANGGLVSKPKDTTSLSLNLQNTVGASVLSVDNTGYLYAYGGLVGKPKDTTSLSLNLQNTAGTLVASVDNTGYVYTSGGLLARPKDTLSNSLALQNVAGTGVVTVDNNGTINTVGGLVSKPKDSASTSLTLQNFAGTSLITADNNGTMTSLGGLVARPKDASSKSLILQSSTGTDVLSVDTHGSLSVNGGMNARPKDTSSNCLTLQSTIGTVNITVDNNGCITLPAAYAATGNLPSTTQLGGGAKEAVIQSSGIISFPTVNTWVNTGATVTLAPGVYILLGWCNPVSSALTLMGLAISNASNNTDEAMGISSCFFNGAYNMCFQTTRIVAITSSTVYYLLANSSVANAATIATNYARIKYIKIA
jgi:hypothetical protein